MGAGGTAAGIQQSQPNAQFGGVQPYLNNAIGAENYLGAGGGYMTAIGDYNAAMANATQQNKPTPYSVGSSSLLGGTNLGPIPSGTGGGSGGGAGMNPYLQQYYQAAALPMQQMYQNTTAPNLLANFAGSGTVGGSGQQSAFANAESGLAQGLGTLGANIYEPAWAQTQQLAAQESMQTQALQAQSQAQAQQLAAQEQMQRQSLGAGLFGQGLGLTQEALTGAPGLASGAYIPSQEMAASGAAGQAQLQSILDTAYKNLFGQSQWPFQALSQLGAGLGPAAGGAGTQVSVGPGMGGFK